MKQYILQNNHLRLVMSADGTLVELTCLTTGTNHIARPGMDLWRVVLSDEESLVNAVMPGNQACVVTSDGERITLTVPRMSYPSYAGTKTVDVALRLSVVLDVDTLRWTAEIENNNVGIKVQEVWAPMINGVRPPADWALYYPQDCGMRMVDPVANLGDRGQIFRFGVSNAHQRELYPGKASMQWMGLYGDSEGLYLCSEDSSLQTICINAERNFGATAVDDSLLFCFIKYPGQSLGTWKSAPVVISPHIGDWHTGAKRYRSWTDTWITPSVPPDWVQKMTGLQDTILREQYGKIVYDYDDIPALHQAAAEIGINLIKITGWHPGGHDNAYPDYEVDPAMGGWEGLERNIKSVQDNGGRMMIYLQAVQMSSNSRYFAEHGEATMQRDPYGDPLADTFSWPGPSTLLPLSSQHKLYNACLACPEWQQVMLQKTQYALDLGADCVYLDRLAGYPGYLCYDESHPHTRPGESYADRVKLGLACRELAQQKNPEVAMASEYINDAGLQPFDFTIPFGFGVHFGGKNFGEMFRYTFPEYIITTQYLNGPEYERLRFALVMGFRFFFAVKWQHEPISSLPAEFRVYAKSLIDLLQANADPFLTGKFVDTEGISNDNPALFAKTYKSENKFGVAVWNTTDEPQPLKITMEDGRKIKWFGPESSIEGELLGQEVALGVAVI